MKNKFFLSPASWAVIIIATLITGYLYWFYSNFTKVLVEENIGPTKEARTNPYFAAEKMLNKIGKQASSHRNFSVLDGGLETVDTLVIESSRVGLSEIKRDTIKSWLSSGGHLILLATEIYNDELESSRDIFLDELGIRLYDSNEYNWDQEEDLRFTNLTFEGTDVVTKIELDTNRYITDVSGDATFIGGNASSDLFAQYHLDDGMISILTDFSLWKNYYIDDFDHAMFLYQLVGGGKNVWFLYNAEQPSLFSTMKETIPLVLISFAILLALTLFSSSWRKGSPRSDQELSQREIMQHIEAAGEFSYRSDDGIALLASLISSLEAKLRLTIYQFSRLNQQQKIRKISQHTGIKEKEVAILWEPQELNQEVFINKVLMAQEIKRRL